MKSRFVLALFVLMVLVFSGSISLLAQAKLNFVSPSFDSPDYQIRFSLEVNNEKILFTEISINGLRPAHYLVFKRGKLVDLTKPLDEGSYDVSLRYAWKGNHPYQVKLLGKPENSEQAKAFEWGGVSPKDGGIPSLCLEGFSRIFRIEEEAGLARTAEIVSLTVTAAKTELVSSNFRIYAGKDLLPFQVVDQKESTPPESVAKSHPVTVTYKLAVPLHVAPYEKKIVAVYQGEAIDPPEQGFVIAGEGLGKSVQNGRFLLQFHPQSGQINTIEYPQEGVKLYNKAGVIHWNPDVFIPGIAWDHSFDWKRPSSFQEKLGAFLYTNSRKGPMPRIRDVFLEVKYTVEKDSPYFVSETRLTVEKDLGVIALRNDEMVLFKELFDSLTYRNRKGELIKLPLKEAAETPFGLVHIAPRDLGWVGLLNTKDRYGFFSLRINAADINLDAPGDFPHKSGTYFYAPSDGDYVYWVRPLHYTWGDFATNNDLTFLPGASSFYEKNAYIVLKLDSKTPDILDNLLKKLRSPLRVL
jgi:hypothetical protein